MVQLSTVEVSVTEPQVCLDSIGCLFELLQVDPGTTAIPEHALRGFGEHRQCFQRRKPVMVLQALIFPCATVVLVGRRMPAARARFLCASRDARRSVDRKSAAAFEKRSEHCSVPNLELNVTIFSVFVSGPEPAAAGRLQSPRGGGDHGAWVTAQCGTILLNQVGKDLRKSRNCSATRISARPCAIPMSAMNRHGRTAEALSNALERSGSGNLMSPNPTFSALAIWGLSV